jgi:hypothetical protein
MDHKLKWKEENYKTFRNKHRGKSVSKARQGVVILDAKTRSLQGEINKLDFTKIF